jgi:hypothetical protein
LSQLKKPKDLQRGYYGELTKEESEVLFKKFQELKGSSHNAA